MTLEMGLYFFEIWQANKYIARRPLAGSTFFKYQPPAILYNGCCPNYKIISKKNVSTFPEEHYSAIL